MKKIISIIVFIWALVLLTISVSATSDPQFYYKVNDNISLSYPCFVNGVNCPSNTTCNITIDYPNSDNVINNAPMINNKVYHTYYLTNATMLGDYNVIMVCSYNSVYKGYTSFKVQVNNIGRKIENTSVILTMLFLLFLFFVILTIVFFNYIPLMGYPFLFLSFFTMSFFFFYLYMNTIGLSKVFYTLFWFSVLMVFVAFVFVAFMLLNGYLSLWQRKKRRDFNDSF